MAEKRTSAPARWDPFADVEWFDGRNPFRDLFRPSLFGRLFEDAPARSVGQLVPAVDIADKDEGYVVTAEIPGTTRDDVTVETKGNLLTIHGEKKNEREGEKENMRWVERRYGSFSRTLTLPADAASEQINASFKDGVLTIEIPKAEAGKPKVVSIES